MCYFWMVTLSSDAQIYSEKHLDAKYPHLPIREDKSWILGMMVVNIIDVIVIDTDIDGIIDIQPNAAVVAT